MVVWPLKKKPRNYGLNKKICMIPGSWFTDFGAYPKVLWPFSKIDIENPHFEENYNKIRHELGMLFTVYYNSPYSIDI